MKFAVISLVTFTFLGCSEDSVPTVPAPFVTAAPAPAPIPGQTTFVWVVVIDDAGVCIRGATVEVVGGQGLGKTVAQNTPCSYWDPDFAAQFRDLIPGVPLTLRASAEGYGPGEVTVVPTLGPQTATGIELSRLEPGSPWDY